MKKYFLYLILMMFLPFVAFAEVVEIRGIYYKLDDENGTAEVTSNPKKYTGYVDIPRVVNYIDNSSYVVKSIGEYAFDGCDLLSHVDIPNTIKSIGIRAFRGCRNILSISIPESIDSIGVYAFEDCAFQHVSIENLEAWCNIKFDSYKSNPTSCSDRVLLKGKNINDLELPEGMTEIKDFTFYNFHYLKSIVIPSSVTRIGRYAFNKSKFLQDINISDSIEYIGYGSLDNTAWFDSQPDGMVYAGLHAYGYKGKMPKGTNIEIKEGTKSVVGRAFYECAELNSIIFPSSLEAIGDYSFSYCFNLTDVVIPSGVQMIGSAAFYDCTSLSFVEIGSGVRTICESAFGMCRNLSTVRCLAEIVPDASAKTFNGSFEKAILYVPASAISNYKSTEPWNKFKKILTLNGEEDEDTNIHPILQNVHDNFMMYYSIDGKPLYKNRRGINIIFKDKKPIKVVSK